MPPGAPGASPRVRGAAGGRPSVLLRLPSWEARAVAALSRLIECWMSARSRTCVLRDGQRAASPSGSRRLPFPTETLLRLVCARVGAALHGQIASVLQAASCKFPQRASRSTQRRPRPGGTPYQQHQLRRRRLPAHDGPGRAPASELRRLGACCPGRPPGARRPAPATRAPASACRSPA